MNERVEHLKSLQVLIEEAQAEAEELKAQIKQAMGDREEILCGMFKISCKKVSSTRIDAKSLRAELPEIAERYSRRTECYRLTIS